MDHQRALRLRRRCLPAACDCEFPFPRWMPASARSRVQLLFPFQHFRLRLKVGSYYYRLGLETTPLNTRNGDSTFRWGCGCDRIQFETRPGSG